MRDWIWVAAAAAAIGFGFFFIKKLDLFLEKSHRERNLRLSSEKCCLRIGLSNPMTADGLSDLLECFSADHPNADVQLLSGTDEELLRALSDGRLDMAVLPGDVENPDETYFDVREILLHRTPVILKYGGLSIEPITREMVVQKVLWLKTAKTPLANDFIGCLQDRFVERDTGGGKVFGGVL